MHYINAFIDKICAHHDVEREEALHEFERALREATKSVIGPADFDVQLAGHGAAVYRMFVVRNEVTDPARELDLGALRATESFADAEAGEEILLKLPMHLSDLTNVPQLEVLESVLPEPLYNPELRPALEGAITQVVHRWFPWRQLPAGSVGRLLEDGGDWLIGLRGEANGVTLEIVSASLTPKAEQPNSTWLNYSMTFALEKGGAASEYTIAPMGDHEGNLRDGLELQASTDARPRVEETLSSMAEELAERDWGAIGGLNRWPLQVLAAAQCPPAPNSLFSWCEDEVIPTLLAEPIIVELAHGRLEVKRQDAWLNERVLSGFKEGWVNVLALQHEGDSLIDVVEGSFRAGFLTGPSYEPAEISSGLQTYATGLVDKWHEAIEAELRRTAGEWGARAVEATRVRINLLQLIEFAHLHGLPPDPPVPAFGHEAFERGAQLLDDVSADDLRWVESRFGSVSARPMATLRVGSWLLVFGADRSVPPHNVSEIWLREGDSEEAVQVLLTDVWNPTTRWSIDGDAFAFRRFTQWLRGVLEAAGIDEQYEFAADEWDDGDEPSRLSLAQWLLFDEVGDDSDMLDWRCQNYVVAAGHPLIGAAGMFGFGGELTKKLEEGSHAAIWRRFLGEIVDERFGD